MVNEGTFESLTENIIEYCEGSFIKEYTRLTKQQNIHVYRGLYGNSWIASSQNRKYFSYDMEIISNQGNSQITADLSKKQGSASNGEKQTPYFIILAASLMQYYPRQSCCARLAFIDEAFSALSRERIEQMVKYLEANGFQVIYAAPPEKISSIDSSLILRQALSLPDVIQMLWKG